MYTYIYTNTHIYTEREKEYTKKWQHVQIYKISSFL